MDKNLKSYVKTYSNWYDKDKLDKLITDIDSAHWQQHEFYNAAGNTTGTRSGDKELDVAYSQSELKPYVMQRIWDGFHRYLSDLNFSWYAGWQGFSDVRFNRYKETRVMAEHCDHITSLFQGERKGIPTMTSLSLLNDEFEGGELVMFGDEVIPFKAGDIMIFPSNFLYPHRIEPVLKGIRYSCVSWAW
jgi:hypothetical protein